MLAGDNNIAEPKEQDRTDGHEGREGDNVQSHSASTKQASENKVALYRASRCLVFVHLLSRLALVELTE